jgi:hypothetical protein
VCSPAHGNAQLQRILFAQPYTNDTNGVSAHQRPIRCRVTIRPDPTPSRNRGMVLAKFSMADNGTDQRTESAFLTIEGEEPLSDPELQADCKVQMKMQIAEADGLLLRDGGACVKLWMYDRTISSA